MYVQRVSAISRFSASFLLGEFKLQETQQQSGKTMRKKGGIQLRALTALYIEP